MKKQILLVLGACWFLLDGASAQNMLSPASWTIGSGSVTGFHQNGGTVENSREWGEGPFGRAILWKATPLVDNGPDGGFNTPYYPIDHTKMYRLSIWIKKTGSNSGSTYLGTGTITGAGQSPLVKLWGTPDTNPYFFATDLPSLDKWYLVVGFVHGSGDNSTIALGGIYDGETGVKVANLNDFKFQVGATDLRHRSYLFYVTDPNDRQYFFAPRMEEVNGDEPTIAALLGLSPQAAINSSIIYPARVGINTSPAGMGNYELAVNGEIRAKEIKVETGWADFVFEEDYQLMPLEELETFIKANKHLPVIPTAQEVANHGVKLGEMDKLLLQKIEELSLYIIEQNKVIKKQGEQLEELKSKILDQK